MRKEGIIAVFLVLYAWLALAEGEIKTIDFSNSSIILAEIGEKDGIRFNLGGDHKILIREINKENQRAELTTFIEGAPTPYYTSLYPETTLKLDFDRDQIQDMEVSLVKIMNEKRAVFAFQKISEPKNTQKPATKPVNLETNLEKFKKYYTNPLLIGGVAIIALVLISSSRFIRRKYRRMRRSVRID